MLLLLANRFVGVCEGEGYAVECANPSSHYSQSARWARNVIRAEQRAIIKRRKGQCQRPDREFKHSL